MQGLDFNNISTDPISLPGWKEKNIRVCVLRLDKINPVVSGNKWYKLRFYIEDAINSNKQTIATFGGAWSNHIVATAAACHQKNLSSIGIIRGEKPTVLSGTLQTAQSFGMKLYFPSRKDYQEKKLPEELNAIKQGIYFINEGGYGERGAAGAATIAELFESKSFTHVCCAVGTGTMMAGLIKSASSSQHIVGISVLKNNFSHEEEIKGLLQTEEVGKSFSILHDYHFAGYAKFKKGLIDFMNDFFKETSIPSDFVYTGKLFYAVNDLILKNFFPAGSEVLIVHSGGLQGNSSLRGGLLIF